MEIFAKTDIGLKRQMNQDFIKIKKIDDETALLVVCDGMGGAKAGNIASEVAANSVYEIFMKKYKTTMNDKDLKTLMTSAVNCANLDVFDLAENNEEYYGMGTTVVAAFISDGYAYVIHAGDSRGYLVYPDSIKQITTDHSIVQQMIENNLITKEEAKNHPKRNVITRALGVDECLESDFNVIRLERDATIILCSDGLTNYVSDDVIRATASENSVEEACNKLIELANENGGGDNISVAVAKI